MARTPGSPRISCSDPVREGSGSLRSGRNRVVGPGTGFRGRPAGLAPGIVCRGRPDVEPQDRIGVSTRRACQPATSLSRGYRAPSVSEQFTSTTVFGFRVVPNLELRGESAWAGEVGATAIPNDRLWFDAGIFWSEYRGLIEVGVAPKQFFTFQFQNVAEARVRESTRVSAWGSSPGSSISTRTTCTSIQKTRERADTSPTDRGTTSRRPFRLGRCRRGGCASPKPSRPGPCLSARRTGASRWWTCGWRSRSWTWISHEDRQPPPGRVRGHPGAEPRRHAERACDGDIPLLITSKSSDNIPIF